MHVWRLQCVGLGYGPVRKEVFWESKPSYFILADYVPAAAQTLLKNGSVDVGGARWTLEKIQVLP